MEVLLPRTLDEALAMKADHPEAIPLAGGTDLMVEINFGRIRPDAVIDITRLAAFTPLVQASRSVGSPQIRNRGTVGGNLGTASPAGDALPVLAAYEAEVVLRSRARGERSLPWNAFLTGPKKTALAPDELIIASRWRAVRGPGSFSKIGTRNAMVIAVAGLCLVLDEEAQRVKVALGSVAPTIIRASQAEDQISAALQSAGAWKDPSVTLSENAITEFAELVA